MYGDCFHNSSFPWNKRSFSLNGKLSQKCLLPNSSFCSMNMFRGPAMWSWFQGSEGFFDKGVQVEVIFGFLKMDNKVFRSGVPQGSLPDVMLYYEL